MRRRCGRKGVAHSASGMLAGSTKSDHASQTPSCARSERRVSRGAGALGCLGTTHRERSGVVGIESYVVVGLDKHATPRSAHGDGNAEQELETDARGSTRASGAQVAVRPRSARWPPSKSCTRAPGFGRICLQAQSRGRRGSASRSTAGASPPRRRCRRACLRACLPPWRVAGGRRSARRAAQNPAVRRRRRVHARRSEGR